MEGPSEIVEKAAQKLSHPDPRRRFEGVDELAAVANRMGLAEKQEIVALLSDSASDSEPFVRWNLALALGAVGHESGVEVLEKMVQDPYEIAGHLVVRDFVAMALGKIGDPSGVPALAKLADDEDGIVRWHAAVALGDIGHESGIPYLAELLDDPIPFCRAHAGIALVEIGHKDGLPYLEKLTQDSMPRVAQIAREALASVTKILDEKERASSGSTP